MWGVIARIAAAAVVVAAVQHQLGSIYDAWRSDVTGTDGAPKFFPKTEGDDDVAGTGERSGDGDGKEKGFRGKSGSRGAETGVPGPGRSGGGGRRFGTVFQAGFAQAIATTATDDFDTSSNGLGKSFQAPRARREGHTYRLVLWTRVSYPPRCARRGARRGSNWELDRESLCGVGGVVRWKKMKKKKRKRKRFEHCSMFPKRNENSSLRGASRLHPRFATLPLLNPRTFFKTNPHSLNWYTKFS